MSAEPTSSVEPTAPGPQRNRIISTIAHWLTGDAGTLPDEGPLAPLDGASGWLNSEPLTAADMRGHVVLVDFWTYTCVNWIRTLPYLREWHAKYEADGLLTVGVHSPEFSFERETDNVTRAARNLDVSYPIALDSDFQVWQAFSNRFWPALYIADANGRLRHHHFGEGEYAQTEMVLQRLLLEAGADMLDTRLVEPSSSGLEVAADWRSQRSPETYLGLTRANGFVRAGVAPPGVAYEYSGQSVLTLNSWDLEGTWTDTGEAIIAGGAGARIAFEFHSRDVNLVMGPGSSGAPIPFAVTLDGNPPGKAAGGHVDSYGHGVLRHHDAHQLIRQPNLFASHRFEIEFFAPAAAAYCFTFG
ncbi:redoxin domain-containing protein [Microbacterium immunditiarum]|uniref:Thiol-disulfide isomerase/thioredoxin n=1 Tax=Microbacterium immunditiarum TaxID=337480 RepID=A0A7Y9GP23_9MICO|nr:redoxin domain-containing protein [Microbacterium immunditiarum]NYE20070.1 thiol-disulfide isomerase/thioredoxin [Microbacterium immunditiarum]